MESHSRYTLASAYKAQFFGSFSEIDYNKLWKSKVQLKCKFFMWLWLWQRILMGNVLQIRGMDHGEQCIICEQEQETATHLIMDCPYAQVSWHLLAQWMGADGLEIQRFQFGPPAHWWLSRSDLLAKDQLILDCGNLWGLEYLERTVSKGFSEFSSMPDRQLLDLIKDDLLLLLGTYLQEKARGDEPGVEPAISE